MNFKKVLELTPGMEGIFFNHWAKVVAVLPICEIPVFPMRKINQQMALVEMIVEDNSFNMSFETVLHSNMINKDLLHADRCYTIIGYSGTDLTQNFLVPDCESFIKDLYEIELKRKKMSGGLKSVNAHVEPKPAPGVVCLCGSLRFKKDFGAAELKFVLDGWIVLTPCCMYVDAQRTDSFMEHKKQFDKTHFAKIDISDLVYVLNVGGYIGESTRNEINHAESMGIPVKYLEPLK